MPLSRLPCNIIIGFTLLFLVACDTTGPDPALLSASLDPPLSPQSGVLDEGGKMASLTEGGKMASLDEGGKMASLDEGGKMASLTEGGKMASLDEGGKMAALDPDGPATLSFLGGSQESGFSSEEAEDPKALQSQYFWDEVGEVNGTNLDPDSTDGDSPAGFQPSSLPPSLPGEVPSDLNSSTSLVPLGESLDPDLWEIQGETSGTPAEPAYDPPATGTAPPTPDSDAGPVLLWDGRGPRGTAPPHEEGAAEAEEGGLTHVDFPAHLTTEAGVAAYFPTDEAEGEQGGEAEGADVPSVLKAVAGVAEHFPTDEAEGEQRGEAEGADVPSVLNAVAGMAEPSPTDEAEGADVPSVLNAVAGVAESSPTDEAEGADVPSVLNAVAGVAEPSPTDEAEGELRGETEGEPGGWGHHTPLTTVPSSSPSSSSSSHTGAFTDIPWHKAAPTLPQGREPKPRQGSAEFSSETDFLDKHPPHDSLQVICVDWSDLTGKGYVILNMSENFDCDEFRVENGDQLLEMLETAFSRKMNSPQGSWLISLSKPVRQDRQLLMTLASEQGVIATKDVLSMLGEIRRGLHDIGIQNYTSMTSCQSRPSQMRSDYGKLFVVLVIIGSVCVVIIASGLAYICWQRRLPKLKNTSRGEELHFVENGCHDNPTLDVASDNQSEMLEKKHSANGVVAGGGGGSGWQVLVNKPGKEEAENLEEDTHL
ncbi:podocalyxin-like protein 2 [Anguilla anguilla]|uniref:podocalyxin-like protein 2 n=1 Tax=Anguilla anguilla TaxID=7936 RepID=UPI0015A95CCC|nr:podocalyxin-like protein 2 [Anguilla anguilla]